MILFQNCTPFITVEQSSTSSFPTPLPPMNPTSPAALYEQSAFGKTGLQRLTNKQLLLSIESIFNYSPLAFSSNLPIDSPTSTYFENDFESLSVTDSHIQGYNSFAESYATKFIESPSRVSALSGCTPSNDTDVNCFSQFVSRVGRLALRRNLTASEIDNYINKILPIAGSENNFYSAIQTTIMIWLQHPEFLYRIESEGPRTLNQFEIATRISFLIVGTTPDKILLDAAQNNQLSTEAQRLAQADRLLDTIAAKRNISSFHAQWLGYENSVLLAGMEDKMVQETSDLIDRVVFETDSDWLKLFTWNQTKIDAELATHYNLPSPGPQSNWVSYPAGRAAGILSHGTFARLGAKFNDTSPTLRGYEIYKRLFCGVFTATIPASVDIDNQPGSPTDCKVDRYSMRKNPTCSACHSITDNIGFGLEKQGAFGEWRTTEPGLPRCVVEDKGSYESTDFKGLEEFANIISNHPNTAACATKQLFEFSIGRKSTNTDERTLKALHGQYIESRSLKSLFKALIKSAAMTYKGE